MAVARKPKSPQADALALIHKGGSPAAAAARKITPIALRVPTELLARLDAARGTQAVALPRNTWILQAIAEKLAREADS